MKYNITKSYIYPEKKQIIEFLCKGITLELALIMLWAKYETEDCKMMQDVEDYVTDPNNLDHFDVIKNGQTIRYEIEQDSIFAQMAQSFKRKTLNEKLLETINYN